MRIFTIMILALTVAACGTTSTTGERGPYGAVQLEQVTASVDSHVGQTVRWGGKIIEVKNFQNYSQIQLVQFPLNRRGRPIETDDSAGRFYVRSDAFLDPEIYTVGSMLTVNGEVVEKATLKVDQKDLVLPVVTLAESQRWPSHTASGRPYNPKHDWPFVGYGYYATGSYSP